MFPYRLIRAVRTAYYIEFEENQEPDLDDDKEDSLLSNDMRSPSNYSKNSVPMHSQTKSASEGKKKRQNGMIRKFNP